MNIPVAAESRLGVCVRFVQAGVLAALLAAASLALGAGPAEAVTPGAGAGAGAGGYTRGYTPLLAQFDPTALGNEILTAVAVFIAIGVILAAAGWAFKRSVMAAVGIVLVGAVLMAFAANYEALTEVGNFFLEGGGLGGGGGQ